MAARGRCASWTATDSNGGWPRRRRRRRRNVRERPQVGRHQRVGQDARRRTATAPFSRIWRRRPDDRRQRLPVRGCPPRLTATRSGRSAARRRRAPSSRSPRDSPRRGWYTIFSPPSRLPGVTLIETYGRETIPWSPARTASCAARRTRRRGCRSPPPRRSRRRGRVTPEADADADADATPRTPPPPPPRLLAATPSRRRQRFG